MSNIEKTGPLGVVIATFGCPACFPAFAGLLSTIGISASPSLEGIALKFVQIFIIISMVLAYFTYKRNKYKPTFILTEASGVVMLVSFFTGFIGIYYTTMVFLLGASIWNFIIDKKLLNCKDGVCNTVCMKNK